MKAARELVKGPGVVSVSSLLDDKLCGDADLVEVERACKVACWCIQDDEADRPTMAEVVQVLEGVLDCDLPPLPRLLATIFGRPHSSTEHQTTTVSDTSTSSGPFSPRLVSPQLPKSCYSTCHIECLRPVHGALNVDEKKN